MALTTDFDKMFCVAGKKWNIKKLLLKAIAINESSLDPKAYRFEAMFWDNYLANNPEWKDKDPKIVSASHGICQIMFTTAWSLGLTGEIEKVRDDLLDPSINIMLAAKLMRLLIDKSIKKEYADKYYWLSNAQIACAMFNGGSRGNPAEDGTLRNQKYVRKIFKTWGELKRLEKECDPD
jgi:hypothetical protein